MKEHQKLDDLLLLLHDGCLSMKYPKVKMVVSPFLLGIVGQLVPIVSNVFHEVDIPKLDLKLLALIDEHSSLRVDDQHVLSRNLVSLQEALFAQSQMSTLCT